MRLLTTTAASVLLAFGIAPASGVAEAAGGILKCTMPDGTSAYTREACSDLGATASPMDSTLLDRLAREERRDAALRGEVDDGANAPGVPIAGVRRDVTAGCARSPDQLARDLASSMAMQDVNRMAESFDWKGMDNAQAQRVMDALQRMAARERLVDADYFDARAAAGNAGFMQLTFDQGGATRTAGFDVDIASDCYFLRYA